MKAIMIMFDSLNRRLLQPYGCEWTHTPNFRRLAEHTVRFDNCYAGSLPCMPARRELHTGRYNFLHRSWGPLEPFDDSMPELLRMNGIYTHLTTDHYHYFEDGGCTYHTRYSSYESFRGQEGDAWKPLVDFAVPATRNTCGEPEDQWIRQDYVNRRFMPTAAQQSQTMTFQAGLEFIDNNHDADNWFLHIETFDPHEPFFTDNEYKQLFPHDYSGPDYDWPEYRPVDDSDSKKDINHLRMEYASLLAMCDASLGRVLDAMDNYSLWEDTLLIVNTDHGFLLGEHKMMGKCYCPFFNEVAHIPLFIWDPNLKKKGESCASLIQTIDLPATLLAHFGVVPPADMLGLPIQDTLKTGKPLHEVVMFGIFGGLVSCTDGRYLYMRQPAETDVPLYQYTLMPTRHGGRRAFIDRRELQTARLHAPFSFTKGMPVLKIMYSHQNGQHQYPTVLYDLKEDPYQSRPIKDEQQETRLLQMMQVLMQENDTPSEQYLRYGLMNL